MPPGEGDNRFWAASLVGKRLAVMGYCDKTKFITTGLFKTVTGDDPVPIERKGRDLFTAYLSVKFYISSNEKPVIESKVSALRRIIFCEISAFDKSKTMSTSAYDAALRKEAHAIVYKCLDAYNSLCQGGKAIEMPEESYDELTADGEERWEEMARRWLNLYDDTSQFNAVPYAATPHVTTKYMDFIRRMEKLSKDDYPIFKSYLKRKYGVRYHLIKQASKGKRVYLNCTAIHDKLPSAADSTGTIYCSGKDLDPDEYTFSGDPNLVPTQLDHHRN
jgi:hypothetical protein